MRKYLNYRLEISDFDILSNGYDGGHKYLKTIISFNGKMRRVSVLFKNRQDEERLSNLEKLVIEGELADDGNEDLLITKATIVN